MLTLVLLRHAKSSWNAGGLADYDRPLAKRGQKAAPEVGAALAALGVRPDLVLCSGAARTRETLGLVLAKLGGVSPRVVYDDAIYMATPAALLSLLRKIPDGANGTPPRSVMIVGHNPGLEEFAALVVGRGGEDELARMSDKFPTGAAVVISFNAASWGGIEIGGGSLEHYLTPKRLP